MSWFEAMEYAKNHESAGYDDWRLPTINELKTILKKNQNPAIDDRIFIHSPAGSFWSSSTYSDNGAFYLGFERGGYASWYRYNYKRYIRLIRRHI
jgi:hypothetical protein